MTLAVLANIIIAYFGSPSVYGSIMCFIVIISGLGSSIHYSVTFMKYKHQEYYQQVYGCLTITFIFTIFLFVVQNWPMIYIPAAALFGFFTFPVIPTQLELITRNYPEISFFVTNTILFTVS